MTSRPAHPLKKLAFLALLLIPLDLMLGLPVVWQITRSEAWVRIGDPELHHTFRPGSSQTERYGPIRIPIFVNSLGGKDDSCREVPRVASGPRVAIFGDSFAEGWGLPFAETIPGILRQRLAPAGVNVLGFGMTSYGPSLEARWMKKLIREGVRWDTALLFIDAGDSWDEMFRYRTFLDGGLKIFRNDKPLFFRLRWYEYSLTYQAVRQIREALRPKPSPGTDFEQAVGGNPAGMAWLDQTEAHPWFQQGLEQSAAAVREMKNLARTRGFALMLVIYPWPKMIAQGKLENDYNRFWSEFAKREGIPLMDLTPLFVEPGKSAEEIYRQNFIPGDFHWNAQGSARITEFLLPWIQKNLPVRPETPVKINP